MALGATLRNARLSRKLTLAQVSSATQMTIPILEAIEREDFSKVAAPIYGKGFIRLYATCVGLDPKPLIDEFMSRFAPVKAAPLVTDINLNRKDKFSAGIGLGTTVVEKDELGAEAASAGSVMGKRAEKGGTGEQTRPGPRAGPLLQRLGSITRKIASGGSQLLEKSVEALEKKDADSKSTWTERRASLRDTGFLKIALKYLPVTLSVLIILIFLVSSLSRCARKSPPQPSVPAQQQGPEKLRVAIDPPEPYLDQAR